MCIMHSMFVPVHHSVYDGHNGNQAHNQRQFSSDHGHAKTEINLLESTYILCTDKFSF